MISVLKALDVTSQSCGNYCYRLSWDKISLLGIEYLLQLGRCCDPEGSMPTFTMSIRFVVPLIMDTLFEPELATYIELFLG